MKEKKKIMMKTPDNIKLAPVMNYIRTLRCMRFNYFTLFSLALMIFMGSVSSVHSQEVLMDLQYNPALFKYKKNATEKSIMNNQEYFPIDTMKLPFIDDFSTNKLKRYYKWEYTDSINMVVCSEPAFSRDSTFHYYYTLDTVNLPVHLYDTVHAHLDSIVPYLSHVFTFCNPFVPNDFDTASFFHATNDYTFSDTIQVAIFDTAMADSGFSRTIRAFHQFSAIRWTYNGDTAAKSVSLDSTFHYYYTLDTVLNDTLAVNIIQSQLDSAVMLTPYPFVYYNGYNPFIPNDTIYYWPTVEYYTFSDTNGVVLHNDSVQAPSTLITNALDTVWIYEPDTGTVWIDHDVFINSTYPVRPPSIGVATFDGVDETGMPYEFVTGLPEGIADHLTSKPLDLHTYTPSSNIYLSFFYQPQGMGNAPEQNDSLILQFRTPKTDWKNTWSSLGSELSSDSTFKQVMLEVADTTWLKNGFQFRFLNYGTLSGNVDHWHIDYVRLDRGRSLQDTVFDDVAFVYPVNSLLKDFQSMPWSHFLVDPSSFMNDTLVLTFHNNNDTLKNTDYKLNIFDNSGLELYDKLNTGNKNFTANVYCHNIGTECDSLDPLPMNPDYLYVYPDNGNDSATFEVVASLATNPDHIKSNDTLRYNQVFDNYYAYDDGTAENGYGLEIQGTTGVSMAAYRFSLIKSDTLRGVRFYFNPQLEDVSQKLFTLTVWTGNETPETIIYEKDSLSPIYSPELNGFRTYTMNDDTLIVPAGNFFVGWKQLTNYRINVGFDRNINANKNMFFNVLGGGWIQSQLPGAWMIRPVFSKDTLPPDVFAIEENTVMTDFSIFPNPASDEVYIVPKDENGRSADYTVNIFNSMGSIVKQVGYLPRAISINALAPGFYFISIQHKETQEQKTYKLVISR